jgi:hypothetical protein
LLVDDLGEYKAENDRIFGGITHQMEDKYLLLSCVSNDFVKLDNKDVYTYYHLLVKNNGDNDERFGVWANGLLMETPSKNYCIQHQFL